MKAKYQTYFLTAFEAHADSITHTYDQEVGTLVAARDAHKHYGRVYDVAFVVGTLEDGTEYRHAFDVSDVRG